MLLGRQLTGIAEKIVANVMTLADDPLFPMLEDFAGKYCAPRAGRCEGWATSDRSCCVNCLQRNAFFSQGASEFHKAGAIEQAVRGYLMRRYDFAEHGFWTSTGCKLPRPLRSDICLSYVCCSSLPHAGAQVIYRAAVDFSHRRRALVHALSNSEKTLEAACLAADRSVMHVLEMYRRLENDPVFALLNNFASDACCKCAGEKGDGRVCCISCYGANGWFGDGELHPDPVVDAAVKAYLKREYVFISGQGYWRAGGGCCLPRPFRSKVCTGYICAGSGISPDRLSNLRQAITAYIERRAKVRMELLEEWNMEKKPATV